MISDLSISGYPINDAASPTPLYKNNNGACVKWCHNMTSKGNRHIKLKENIACEWVKEGAITVTHVGGKHNPSNIFTTKMRDGANFRRLHDSFICRGLAFLKGLHILTLPILDPTASDPVHIAQTAHYIMPTTLRILEVLLSNSLFCTLAALLGLLNAGQHIFSRISVLCRTL